VNVDGSAAAGAVTIVAAYVLGTLPTAHLVAGRHGVDPTRVGSGNPGATNVMRAVGKRAGALTLAGDVVKGLAAAGLGWAVGGRDLAIFCGVAAVVGHILPVTRRFQGGRGVATGFGMTVVIFPIAVLAGVAWFYAVRGAVGRPSLLSQAGIVLLPGVAVASGATAGELVALTACSALVLAKLWVGRRPDGPDPAELSADGATA
jgi:glycerol-3-phosphate acyltransferase PlsY